MTDITIEKGATFSRVLRWEAAPLVYKAITAVTKAAPVAITATAHGLKTGWRVAVVGMPAGGMRQLNAPSWNARLSTWTPRATDFQKCTVTDANIITLNNVISTEYDTYTSGGSLVYYTPVSLASFTARFQVRATAETTGTALIDLTTENGGIALDDTNHTVTLTIAATATAAYTFETGVFQLELASGAATPVVTRLWSGNVTVSEEVAR